MLDSLIIFLSPSCMETRRWWQFYVQCSHIIQTQDFWRTNKRLKPKSSWEVRNKLPKVVASQINVVRLDNARLRGWTMWTQLIFVIKTQRTNQQTHTKKKERHSKSKSQWHSDNVVDSGLATKRLCLGRLINIHREDKTHILSDTTHCSKWPENWNIYIHSFKPQVMVKKEKLETVTTKLELNKCLTLYFVTSFHCARPWTNF